MENKLYKKQWFKKKGCKDVMVVGSDDDFSFYMLCFKFSMAGWKPKGKELLETL